MAQTISAKTITILRYYVHIYGLPEQIVSNNGPQFTSDKFWQFI